MALTVTGSPPACVLGQPYSFQPTVSGGVAPYVFGLTGTPLPAGLYFDNFQGVVLGTPASQLETISGVVFTATDTTNATASLTFGLTIGASTPAAPVVTGYDPSVPSVSGTGQPGATLAITIDGQPLFGTATVPSSGNWRHLLPAALSPYTAHTVSATQTFAGLTSAASAVFSLLATATPPVAAPQPPPLGGPSGGLAPPGSGPVFLTTLTITGAPSAPQVGVAYSFTPTVAGGVTPYAFALTGTLPAGLSFSTTSGAITGTPTTAGTTSGLNITVTGSSGQTASLGAFSLTVSPAASAAAAASHTADNSNTTADTTALTADAA